MNAAVAVLLAVLTAGTTQGPGGPAPARSAAHASGTTLGSNAASGRGGPRLKQPTASTNDSMSSSGTAFGRGELALPSSRLDDGVSEAPIARPLVVARAHSPRSEAEARVDVRILSRHKPVRLRLDGPRSLEVAASGDRLFVDGRARTSPLDLDSGRWQVRGRGLDRRYDAALSVTARAGELIVVATFALEDYVAAVTASETEIDTPFEALRAQAITARAYVLASGKRHEEARACDLTHCQVLRGEGFARHLARARAAARATRGVVLRLPDGSIALAPFHASCGGHTADPVAVFGAPDRTGAAAVPDRCPASPWRATVPRSLVMDAASEVLGGPAQAADLLLERDVSGAVSRVVDRASGRAARGDALFRALGVRAGWDRIRSARFTLTLGGEQALLEGQGHGHGVGLCQAGAALLARQGWTAEQLLAHYFPRALLKPLQE
jgi:stage II sporulation protein D